MTLRDYVLRHLISIPPKCGCGCKEEVQWHKTRYRFNDYVTGHNPTGFRVKQHNHTSDEIAHRNECIRQAYKNPDLKRKIASSVHEAFKDPVKNKNLRQGQKRGWDDVARKKRQTEHAIKLQALGKIGPQAPFKTQWMTNPFTGKDEYMHSSWETAFLEKCISEQYPVTKVHSLRVPYIDTVGDDRTYIPDFIALEERVVFEIKGYMSEADECKLQALDAWANENAYEVVIIDHES